MMSRRSSSTDRSSLGPLRVRTDNNKQTSGRRSRSSDAKGRPSNIGRPTSGNRSSFGTQSGIPRRSVVGQISKFGQGLQTQKNRLSRSSIFGSRGSSIGLRGAGTIPKDPRPISDKGYQHKCIKNLLQFLTDRGYPQNISVKNLQSPNNKDFFRMFEFIYSIVNENYKVGSKPEEEIPRIMKAVGYPFLISKSSMFTVGSPHTWPSMLAALSYMVDWINYGLSANEHVDNILYQSDHAADDGFDTVSEKQIQGQYFESCYNSYLDGFDEFDKENETLEKMLKQKYLGSTSGVDGLLEENTRLEQELELLEQNSDKLKSLKQERDTLLADEERFISYLNDLEIFRRQQDQQMAEVEEMYNNQVIELESEKAKIQQMQTVYDAQEFTPQDVERINIKRREVQRQIDDINRRCQIEDQEICAEEVVLSKGIEQMEGKCQSYNKLAQSLKLIPVSAEHSSGIDYEMKTSFGGYMSSEFSSTIKPALLTLKTRCSESARSKESAKIRHQEQLEQQHEHLSDLQNEVSLLETKYKRADEEVECKKQMFQKELQNCQQEVEQLQSDIMHLENANYMEQDDRVDINNINHWASQKEAEMNKKFEEYKLFFQEALKLFMEHLENCKGHLQRALEESEKSKLQALHDAAKQREELAKLKLKDK